MDIENFNDFFESKESQVTNIDDLLLPLTDKFEVTIKNGYYTVDDRGHLVIRKSKDGKTSDEHIGKGKDISGYKTCILMRIKTDTPKSIYTNISNIIINFACNANYYYPNSLQLSTYVTTELSKLSKRIENDYQLIFYTERNLCSFNVVLLSL